MDFEHSKNTTYMDTMDSPFSYMDNGLEYLQPYPPSPSFGVSMGLPTTSSPMSFNALNLSNTIGDYTYTSSPARPYTPADGASISPPTLSYTLSAGELSSDGLPHSGRHSHGSVSRSSPSIPYAATVPRSHRFNPIMAPPARANARAAHRRRSSRSNDESDDEDEDFQPATIAAGSPDSRRETIRKQRIESEQRRRDELRDGYAQLKDTLPPSTQKSSKVSLLERATTQIINLEGLKKDLLRRVELAEAEVHRLRTINEALMIRQIPGNAGSF